MNGHSVAQQDQRRLSVVRGSHHDAVLGNLLRASSEQVLDSLSEQHGLLRVPGLTKQALLMRIMNNLTARELYQLKNELIAARYGALSVDGLIKRALVQGTQRADKPAPRLDHISSESAVLVEGSTTRWHYTMRGHDVFVDTTHRALACDCGYFQFAARRHTLCKHLAMVFTLIPEVYAREALIDLLVTGEYGGYDTPRWRFVPIHKQQAA